MAAVPRDPDVIAYETFAGLRNDVAPHRFEMSDLALATNVDIDASGGLARRAGRTLKRAGAVHSLWSDDTTALFVEDGALKQLNADYTATTLRADLTPGLRMAYQKVNDRVYFSNGAQSGLLHAGTVRSWGLPVPPLPLVAATVGDMPAGGYQFAMTYLRSDGQESGAGLAGRITLPAGSGLTFTLPVATDPDVATKAVYLSTPNGDLLYHALEVANAVTAAIYTNDTLELTLPLETQSLSAPPPGHLLGYHRGRMFVALGDTLFYSEPAAYEWFDLRRYLSFDSRITLFAPIEDRDYPGIFVATETSTGWLQGADADAFKYVQTADYGAVPGTVSYVDGSLLAQGASGARMLPVWLSTQGICAGMPGGQVQNLTRAKYRFEAQGSGCALFKPESAQFIAVANS